MGVISKQSVQTTSIVFAGMGLSVIARLIMPFILSEEQIGVLALLDSVSNLFSTIFCLGFIQVAIRVFPSIRNKSNGHHGFLLFGLMVSLIGALLAICTFLLIRSSIFSDVDPDGLMSSFILLISPLIFWRILFKNLDAYMRMIFNTVLGAMLEAFVMKALILVGILLFWMNMLNYVGLVYAYAIALSIPGLVILIASFLNTEVITKPQPLLLSKDLRSQMLTYAVYGLLASASGVIVIAIDQIMMVRMMSVADVGVYSILFFAGTMVNLPGRGVKRIAMPILAEAWEKNDLELVNDIYRKSSMTNLLSGMFLFLVGWACLADALTFLPNYQYGALVFFYIGLGQLIDMMTGVNMEIIAASDRFRMNTWFNVALAALVIVLNLLLIPLYGIVGSALASCIAMTLINGARWYYLKRTYGLDPFTRTTWLVILLSAMILLAVSLVELPFKPIVNVLIYFATISLVYWSVVLKARFSPDINAFLAKIIRR